MPDEPALLVLWERLLGEILDRTQQFPKHARFTFASRIDALCLDVLTELVRARYAPRGRQDAHLLQVDGDLAVLRTLLRVSADRQYLSLGALEHLTRGLAEAGRMVGGWRTSLARG